MRYTLTWRALGLAAAQPFGRVRAQRYLTYKFQIAPHDVGLNFDMTSYRKKKENWSNFSLGFGKCFRRFARIWVMVGFCVKDTLLSHTGLACPAFRQSVRASKDGLRARVDLVWRASVFACRIFLLARALVVKAEQPLGQARLRR